MCARQHLQIQQAIRLPIAHGIEEKSPTLGVIVELLLVQSKQTTDRADPEVSGAVILQLRDGILRQPIRLGEDLNLIAFDPREAARSSDPDKVVIRQKTVYQILGQATAGRVSGKNAVRVTE